MLINKCVLTFADAPLVMTPERMLNMDYGKVSNVNASRILSDKTNNVSVSTVRRHRMDIRDEGKKNVVQFLIRLRLEL